MYTTRTKCGSPERNGDVCQIKEQVIFMEEFNRRDTIPWNLVMTNGLRLLPFSKYLIQNKSSISWAFMSLFPQGNLAHLLRHQGLSHISTKLLLTETEMATNLTNSTATLVSHVSQAAEK